MRRFSTLLLALIAWCGLVLRPDDARAVTDPLAVYRNAPVVSVLTFGPGDAAFFKFGHNAIRVQDKERKTDLVYNFGTFTFDSPTLIVDFLTGKFRYWLSVQGFPSTLATYSRENRSVTEQRLNISAPSARALNEALIENAKPENASYVYDYYRDNCSTRVRDAIDRALGGGFERRFQGAARLTLREHTLRLVADDFWLYAGLDIAMGPLIDRKITRYDEMFLPEKVAEGLGAVVFSGVHGVSPLVLETRVWYEARGRPPLRRKPPARTLEFFQAGAVIGGLIAFMGWEAYRRRRRWAEVLLATTLALLGVVAGVLGSLFAGLWALTDHEVAYRNENLLQCPPWALGLVVCAVGLLRGRAEWIRWLHRLAAGCLAASVLGLAVKLVPTFSQQNERIIALFLPIWMGVFLACHWMYERSSRTLRIRTTALESTPELEQETDEATPEREPPKPTDDGEDEQDDSSEDNGKRHPSTIPPEPAPA